MMPNIEVRPVDDSLRAEVSALAVHPAQTMFVGQVSDSLADVAVCPGSEALALLEDGAVVGYVRIDRTAAALGDSPFVAGAVALRSFLIDAHRQGRGLGTRALAAIAAYVAGRHPDRQRILLTVNVRNEGAVRAYARAGYVDSGTLYHGGSAGPQHVMWASLPPSNPAETS
ncbi:GNAT family N-acetyltransferase [Luteibacter anthropi]|uniref:GNAT family N-acetyltransferase n=1 Tax=Luteibacter anthropi TaxID=564369 RepID=UPI002032C924|nr:GNAT family N-acetyltransferase [Luteibacter anthropi]URX63573.1 GNAT family N-acetyltransferase [Luteibacter anthropi]